MSPKNVVILDGAGPNDQDLLPVFQILSQVFEADGAQVQTSLLREMKLAHCLGCFNCWVKTPGMCVEADAGREIAKAVIRSDVAVFFTPVTFGGYSPELKKIFERFIQLISPFFEMDHREVHHPPRYTRRPRLIMIGVQRHNNPAEAHIFKTLAGRNAINFHPPSYAAEVVQPTDDVQTLRSCFEVLKTRCDSLPFGEAAASLMPPPVTPSTVARPHNGERRALLIVGSPKINEPSTSAALGGFLVDRLKMRGWDTESLTLRATLNRSEGESELITRVDNAELILLVFPLYADALPYLVTKALTLLADRRVGRDPSPKRLMAIVNSGFPETHQNAVALAICREFAVQNGFTWVGGLAFGAGGMIGAQPLTDAKRSGPSVQHVISALEMTTACLAEGLPVPAEATRMITKKRLYAALFNRFYAWMGGKSFEKLAAKNGTRKDKLLSQPYAI